MFQFCVCLKHIGLQESYTLREIKSLIESGMNYRELYISGYGLVQKALGKQQIENFTIFKDDIGKLQRVNSSIPDDEIEKAVAKILPIAEYCKQNNVDFIYVTGVLPIQSSNDLPYEDIDYSKDNAKRLYEELRQTGIRILDLREKSAIKEIPRDKLFYYTDHHWTMQTAFVAFQEIVKFLEDECKIEINNSYTDLASYDEIVYEKSFLGSFGIKVGKFYSGIDDFVVYVPKFTTSFVFEEYDENGELILAKEGDWLDSLMKKEILTDKKYMNKYNAFSNSGYIENRIRNNCSENNIKVLYISHSYGRSVTQYFATCFMEVRNLDPQTGRFAGNYLDYIDNYKPDIVILQCECEGELIGDYLTER